MPCPWLSCQAHLNLTLTSCGSSIGSPELHEPRAPSALLSLQQASLEASPWPTDVIVFLPGTCFGRGGLSWWAIHRWHLPLGIAGGPARHWPLGVTPSPSSRASFRVPSWTFFIFWWHFFVCSLWALLSIPSLKPSGSVPPQPLLLTMPHALATCVPAVQPLAALGLPLQAHSTSGLNSSCPANPLLCLEQGPLSPHGTRGAAKGQVHISVSAPCSLPGLGVCFAARWPPE